MTGRWMTGWLLTMLMATAQAACPPADWDEASLDRLKAVQFELNNDARRDVLARQLLDCLADPRPHLRDEIAFEALSSWLRAGLIAGPSMAAMRDELIRRLAADDPDGFSRPFAALTLAELARVDRLKPWLDAPARAALLRAAVSYERGVRDYRGFDPAQGWRHGVAHGADLLLQLSLNPALGREALSEIIEAAGSQIAPPGEHFYVYGESERLARPIFYAARRGLHDDGYWRRWLVALADPAPLPNWEAAFKSQAGLARRHNTQQFVQVLFVMVNVSGDDALAKRLQPGLLAALKALP